MTKSSTSRPSRASAWARTPGVPRAEVAGLERRDVVRGLAREAAAAHRVAQLADARAPPAARHAPRARPGERRGPAAWARAARSARATRCRRCAGSGERPGRAAPGPAPGRSARARGRPSPGGASGTRPGTGTMRGSGSAPGGHGQLVGRVPGAEHGEARAAAAPSATVRPSWPSSISRRRAARSSAANARATSAKSTTPVSGEWSAAIPRACGSISRSPSASTRRRPGTSFARPRRSSSSSRRQLRLVARDDQLAALLERDAVLLAVGVQVARALHAQPRLERAGRVVDAGVDHAAVAAGLVLGDLALALEHHHARVRAAPQELARDGEPEDAAAHDGDVAVGRPGHAQVPAPIRRPAARPAVTTRQ